jgi:hypothetical protein
VSEQSFAAFCQERIFDPLGMTSSVINDSLVKLIPGRAGGYYQDEQMGWINLPLVDSVVGPTNVYSTVEDLAKWDENFYTGQVGGRAVVQRMHEPGSLNDGTELDYALGLEVGPPHQHRGWQLVEHGGQQGGHCAWMLRFPDLHLSVVVLFNHFLWGTRDYALTIADLFLEDKPGSALPPDQPAAHEEGAQAMPQAPPETPAPVELGAEQLEPMSGKYYSPERAAIREVALVEGRLQYLGLDLVPVSETRFFFEQEPHIFVEFILAEDGAVTGVRTITPSGEYGYDRVESVTLTVDDLSQYAGRYYSPELDITWRIGAGDDHLVGKRRKYVDSKLTPLFTDAFSDDWGFLMGYPTTYLVVFERDAHESITGLHVSGTRVRHLWFIRQNP